MQPNALRRVRVNSTMYISNNQPVVQIDIYYQLHHWLTGNLITSGRGLHK